MKQLKKKKDFFSLFTIILIFAQAFNYVMTCDDVFFWNKLNQPISKLLGETFINGRYLGNFFGVLFSSVGNSDYFWWIRNIVMGAGIVLLIYLIKKISFLNSKDAFLVGSFILLTAPPRLYNEVYSWTAGYMNYLFPFLGVLLLINYFREIFENCSLEKASALKLSLVFIISLSSQLFMENISLYIIFSMTVLNIVLYIKNKKIYPKAIAGFIGSLIGIVLMFLHPGYRMGSGDTYRSVEVKNLKFLFESTATVFSYVVTLLTAVCIIISILFIIIIKKSDCFKKIKPIFYLIFTLMPTYSILRIILNEFFSLDNMSNTKKFIVNFCDLSSTIFWLAAIFIVVIKVIDYKKIKSRLLFYLCSCVVLSGPMVLITPNGHRCHFGVLVFWAIIACDLIYYLKEKYSINFSKVFLSMKIVTMIVLIFMTSIYSVANVEYIQRKQRIENQIAAGATTIIEKRLPFPTFVHLDGSWFYQNYYYREEPFDIRIAFVKD